MIPRSDNDFCVALFIVPLGSGSRGYRRDGTVLILSSSSLSTDVLTLADFIACVCVGGGARFGGSEDPAL